MGRNTIQSTVAQMCAVMDLVRTLVLRRDYGVHVPVIPIPATGPTVPERMDQGPMDLCPGNMAPVDMGRAIRTASWARTADRRAPESFLQHS